MFPLKPVMRETPLNLVQLCSSFSVLKKLTLLVPLGMFLKATNVKVTDLARQKHLSRRLWCARAKERTTSCSGKAGV